MLMEPEKTGEKATVMLKVEIMVEVNETDEFYDMVEQAKAIAQKRILEAKGFFPFRAFAKIIHPGITVEELKNRTLVDITEEW